MRVAMVSSECEPWAKTGGLADVVDALSRALGRSGHEVDVFLPRYRGVDPPKGARRQELRVDGEAVTVWTGDGDGYGIRLVDHAPSFDRRSLYGDYESGGGGDYPDNGDRFALLGAAALEAVTAEGRSLDVLHGHDWQAVPSLLLEERYRAQPALEDTARVLTVHNLAYGTELLRVGIRTADLVNTVSPTYAAESREPGGGAGLEEDLRGRGDRYVGILNGIDTILWDPANDPVIAAPFDADDLAGREACTRDLLARTGLSAMDDTAEGRPPLLGMVGRLDPQKGFDLLARAARAILDRGCRLVVLGTGQHDLVRELAAVAAERPDRLAVLERFDRDDARRIYAGVDLFLMPSRFEPCGQGQLFGLRYGSLPLARRTGGLADTIRDLTDDPGGGNGFLFSDPDPADLLAAVDRALELWSVPARWRSAVIRGMREDHGWAVPAAEYAGLYERAIYERAMVLSGGDPAPAGPHTSTHG